MGEKPTDGQRIAALEKMVADQARQITIMQRMGGFADAKTIGIRCTRIEERLALLELDGEMLKDVAAHTSAMMQDHLIDRHGEDERSSSIDMTSWRRIRSRLRIWAEARGLMNKRRDVSNTRRDENRTRPREAMPA